MPSTVTNLAPAHAVFEVTHVGSISAADMRSVAKQIQDMTKDGTARHVLSDFTEATSLPGTLELLNLLHLMEEAGLGDGFRQAMVWPKEPQARLSLDTWRTAEKNQGLAAQVFGDRDEALAWLEA